MPARSHAVSRGQTVTVVGSRMQSIADRLAPHLLPAIAFCAAFPAAASGSAPRLQEILGLATVPPYVQATIVGLLAAAATRATPTRRWPLFTVAALDALVRSSGLVVAVASYVAATTDRRGKHLVSYAVVASIVVTLPTSDIAFASALSAPVFVWLPLAIGSWVSARRQVLAGLRERAERLEREQAARSEQARAQERTRIARDMHDVVAHRVSLMVLHAGALALNSNEQTSAQAELIRTTGKEALAQLRSVVGVLSASTATHHPDPTKPQPTLADVDTLVEGSRSAGLRITRRDEGTPRALPVMVEHTAYRVVQEALTNIHKHAPAATAAVVLRYCPSSLDITVENTSSVAEHVALPGSGLGLIGLEERVQLIGGEFVARPSPDGGFLVSARLPT